jgi:hypothetical protein
MSRSLQPLRIMDTVAEVYRDFFRHIGHLPRLALLPFTISFGLAALSYAAGPGGPRFLLAVAGILPVALFNFLWFRLLLFGPNPETLRPLPPFDEGFKRFLLYSVLLMLPLLIMMQAMPPLPESGTAPPPSPQQTGGLLLLLPLLLIYIVAVVGLSFLLPATAAGKNYGPGDAWRDARGVKFQLFAIVIVTLIPVEVISFILQVPLAWLEVGAGLVAPSLLIGTATTYLALPLSTGALAQAYKTRFDWTPPPPATT